MHNDQAAQNLMLNALAAQGKGESIKDTHRSLTRNVESES